MNELDLLVENYFTDSFEASDLFRLVEQAMLSEAGLPASQIRKSEERIRIFITKIETPEEPFTLTDGSTVVLPAEKNKELLSRLYAALEDPVLLSGTLYVTTANGNKITTGKLAKSNVYTASKKLLIRNKGDVAEGILGAAVATAFISGGNQISVADVEAFLDELNQNENELLGTNKTAKVLTNPTRREDGTTDTITCVIRLSTINFNDLMNKDKRSELTGLFNSAVAFANSEEMVEATIAVAANGEDNKVAVVSDGVSKQKKTKIDIKVFLDGKLTPIGRISLKAGGTEQLGQVGGTWEAVAGMFRIMFGIEIDERLKEGWQIAMMPAGRTAKRVQDEAKKIYQDAHLKINKLLNPTGDDVEAEIDLIKTIAAGMNYQVALEDEGIILVHLDAGDFKVLDFAMLEDVLREQEVDLASIPKLDRLNPTIQIVDKKAGNKPLFQIRFKQENKGKTIRHYVEKKEHMVNLLAEARKQRRLAR
jgi:hypothetical protein